MSNKILGIDLGTTNSVASIIEGSTVKIIKQANGEDILPSLVAINKGDGSRLVGSSAENVALDDGWYFIKSVKSSMGKTEIYDKFTNENIIIPKADSTGKKLKGSFRPEEISAIILQELKRVSEDSIGEKIEHAIITVPAYFNDKQRKATKQAAEIAGLIVDRVINEPTAAAVDYGFKERVKGNNNGIALIYDFGGGTFDVSIIKIYEDNFEVVATGGDSSLGGDDIDEIMYEHLLEKFHNEYPPRTIIETFELERRLRIEAVKAKKDLSFQSEVNISLPMIAMGSNGPVSATLTVTRNEFEELIRGLVEITINKTIEIINESGYEIFDLDDVLLVGGSTRIPLVKQMIEETLQKEVNLTVDPDLVVSSGAAIQGGHMSGELNDIVLLDVTPHDLGIILINDEFSPLIKKNTTIPIIKRDAYYNVEDFQESMFVRVVQGNSNLPASKAKIIGSFYIDIVKTLAGKAEVEVSFELDSNGILSVSAIDVATGISRTITIESDGTMTQKDIQKSKLVLK